MNASQPRARLRRPAAPLAQFGQLMVLAAAVPAAAFIFLLANPHLNHEWPLPIPHFFIVTNISLLAAGVALLQARAALQLRQAQILLIALGFMSMAAIFTVHALATPGVLQLGAGAGSAYSGSAPSDYGSTYTSYGNTYGGSVVGLSAYLSLFVPSVLFGTAFRGVDPAGARRFPAQASGLVVGLVILLAAYAGLALLRPDLVTLLPLGAPPYSYAMAATCVALLVFSSWRQTVSYARTRYPMQGALAVAFLLLAQAQVIMVATTFWTLAWWEYHVLMFVAVVMALGALFLELDRRRGLERFLPSEVVERVVSGDLVRLAGERRVVTVVFADLRGSTPLAEQMEAGHIVSLLNQYMGTMARCVFAHGGMVDKFLGDGVMAIFGVVQDASDGAIAAAQAVVGMRGAIKALNGVRAARGEPTLGFGVGMHTGEVVLGTVGIPQRSDFTAIGDTVNTAARLQELTKEFGTDVVMSEQTATRLGGSPLAVTRLGEAAVRGKTQLLRVWTLR